MATFSDDQGSDGASAAQAQCIAPPSTAAASARPRKATSKATASRYFLSMRTLSMVRSSSDRRAGGAGRACSCRRCAATPGTRCAQCATAGAASAPLKPEKRANRQLAAEVRRGTALDAHCLVTVTRQRQGNGSYLLPDLVNAFPVVRRHLLGQLSNVLPLLLRARWNLPR